MDYVQALFSFFIAPLLGAILLGMFWKRATKAGGFWGLLLGITDLDRPLGMWVKLDPSALRYVALSPDAKPMAENMYRALWSVIVIRHRHRGGQPVDQAAARRRARRPGLRRHHAAHGRAGSVLQERVVLGGPSRSSSFVGSQHSISGKREGVTRHAWFRNSNLVLHRSAADRLWRA